MEERERVRIDLVTRRKNGNFVLILVEQGPWPPTDVVPRLSALQKRLHDCVEVAVGGHLGQRYPESVGRHVTLRVDTYGVAQEETDGFLARYQAYLASNPEVQESIRQSTTITGLDLEYQCRSITVLEPVQGRGDGGDAKPLLARVRSWLGRA